MISGLKGLMSSLFQANQKRRTKSSSLSEGSSERNVSLSCFAQFTSSVGCTHPTVRLQLRILNINSWVLQNEQNQLNITQRILGAGYKRSNDF